MHVVIGTIIESLSEAHQVAQVPLQEVEPGKSLGDDLNLDSRKRVELLSIIEQEISTYIDESLLGPTTTVGQLKDLVVQTSPGGYPGPGDPVTSPTLSFRRLLSPARHMSTITAQGRWRRFFRHSLCRRYR